MMPFMNGKMSFFLDLILQCCGIAGTYGFKKENYETSQGIGASLFNQIEEVAADFVATDCETGPGCQSSSPGRGCRCRCFPAR